MKTSRSWIAYVVYVLILIGYVAGSSQLLTYLKVQASMKYDMGPYILWSTVVYVLFGVLLGFDHLYKQIKEEGKWKVNVSKIILLGVPSAFLIIGRIVVFAVGADGIVPSFLLTVLWNDFISTALGILCGFTVISSFYKVTQ